MPAINFVVGGSWVTLTLSMCLMTIVLLLAVRRGKFLYALRKMPYPSSFPIIGNTHHLCCSPELAFKKMIMWAKELGDMYIIWVGMRPFITISRVEATHPLLTSSVHIDKSPEYKYLKPWLGTGLLTSSGERWHSRRKLLTPTFHSGLIEMYYKTVTHQTRILISCLQQEVSKPSFDIIPYVKRASLDVICESSMGCHINAQTDLNNEYGQAVNTVAEIMQRRFLNMWLSFEPIFKLTVWGKQQDHALRVIQDFISTIIVERKEQRKTQNVNIDEKSTKYQALLDLLLDMSEDGKILTDNDIRDEVNTFMFAGHDTTATSISWLLYSLGRHPEYQEKILDEYYNVVGTKELSFDALNKLTWLGACMKESMRLYPAVALIARQIYSPISLSGHDIPVGSTVLVNLFLLHRDPRYFPDPDNYRPERFLPDGPKIPPFAFIPFSAGSRNCIGWKFAIMVVKVMVLCILRDFHVQALDSEDHLRFTNELVLHNASGLRLKITPRIQKIVA